MHCRAREILSWAARYQPKAWVCLDDWALLMETSAIQPHFIQTNPKTGLVARDLLRVASLMECQPIELEYVDRLRHAAQQMLGSNALIGAAAPKPLAITAGPAPSSNSNRGNTTTGGTTTEEEDHLNQSLITGSSLHSTRGAASNVPTVTTTSITGGGGARSGLRSRSRPAPKKHNHLTNILGTVTPPPQQSNEVPKIDWLGPGGKFITK